MVFRTADFFEGAAASEDMADLPDSSCDSKNEFSTLRHYLSFTQKLDLPGAGGHWEFWEGEVGSSTGCKLQAPVGCSSPRVLSPPPGMKRGFSPAGPLRSSPSPERGPRSGAGHRSGTLEHRPKRERKHKTYTLCEVCNIQLNSAAQAQIHYNGKSHQKRLKQISSGKSHGCTGKGRRGLHPPPGQPGAPVIHDAKQ
ncbi:hypothetical protein Z043_103495 [Scleropages formosus]|uniref:U1-type domain-containing protein n=1 Tax=Scleropages formosus TaxID=113540 RepID=A0A0P7V489_SCLFO|nr:hypothetical protein Z043_103495 [Scleropages formosus]